MYLLGREPPVPLLGLLPEVGPLDEDGGAEHDVVVAPLGCVGEVSNLYKSGM